MKLGKLSVGIATAILLSTSFVGTFDAATYVQKSNAISQYSGASLRILNNSKVQFVKANGNYGWSKNPSGSETIKSVHGTKWTLKTNLFDLIHDFRDGIVTSDLLGCAFEPEQRFENPDGAPITFDRDYFGGHRGLDTLPGPFVDPAELDKPPIGRLPSITPHRPTLN